LQDTTKTGKHQELHVPLYFVGCEFALLSDAIIDLQPARKGTKMNRTLLGICTLVGFTLFVLTPAFAGPWPHRPKVPEADTLVLLALGVSGVITAWKIKKGSKRK
jgi:hypothetical protein